MTREAGCASKRSPHHLMWMLGVFILCPLCPLLGDIDPFLRPYVLALDDLGSDGDLVLTVPLRKWRLDDETDIDVLLTHRQESLEYGDVRSRFDLLPFQTSVMPAGAGAWTWLRPGGGTVRFESLQSKAIRERAGKGTSRPVAVRLAAGSRQVFSNGKTRLTVSWSDNQQTIEDSRWVFSYKGGALYALKAPSGRQFVVTSAGRNITRVSENEVLRAEIEWSKTALPVRLWLDGETIHFKVDDTGVLVNVTTGAGDKIAGFTYHKSGLLASITRPSLPLRAFEWQFLKDYTRGDSIYRKPYALLSASGTRYGYNIQNDVIYLSAESVNYSKRLNIGLQYGKVKWISEQPRPSR